ncbi:MAG: ancA 3 [Flavipsychrobacter sp.]|nr:ancA 3 [Flavipsychrobacter sp.]
MKKLLLNLICVCTLFVTASASAQVWVPVGSPQFTPGVALYTSIVIAPDNTPYVCYSDSLHGYAAMVAKYTGGTWVTVGAPDFSAGQVDCISMAIDGSGTPYVAYSDLSNGQKATVMKYDGTIWVTVGSAGFSAGVALFTSIAIDKSGSPYVVYADYNDKAKATVMKYNGSSWVPVGSTGFSAGGANRASITMNSVDTPYVIYSDTALNGRIVVMEFDGTSWGQVDTIHGTAFMDFPSIVIAPGDVPYISFTDYNIAAHATVMKYDGTDWVVVGSPGFSFGTAFYTSLAMDTSGATPVPYVAYQDYDDNGKATVRKYDGTNWVTVGNVYASDSFAYYTSIAIDTSGTPYVAFSDQGNRPGAYGPITVMTLGTPIPPTVAVNDAAPATIASIFPNPAVTALEITSTDKITSVTIRSVTGEAVYNSMPNTKEVHVPISALAPGMYFVTINGNDVRRFVKQ